VTGTNTERQPPQWLEGGRRPINDDFKADPRCRCIGRQEYFDESVEALEVCQSLCVRCSLFQDCTRWTLENYERQPFFIYAGMTASVREKIWMGAVEYYDWRREWHKRYHLAKRARKALKTKLGKRTRKDAELPPCPYCRSPRVHRNGRTPDKSKQRYRCNNCRFSFYQEAL
jgi:hypothetical protein